MRITKSTIDQIFAAIDIVEIVGDFVNLKKSGSNYKALSPFTSEKSPSFYVSPAKQIFKCFSTGKGGNGINFLMEIDNMSYVDALKYAANKYNIEIKYEQELNDEQQQAQSERDALYILMDYAKNYYADVLFNHSDGKAIGMTYFKERGLNEKTIKDFELGFSLDGWQNLIEDAEKKQFSLELLEKAGLIKSGEKGNKYDFFRNRIMFPIHNISGKVIALAGRVLKSENNGAKYINSPETELYHKNQILYGIYQAKQAIRQEDNCLLVEGYMDALALYQSGIHNVVASSGTSLTPEQVKLVSRFTKNITVLYDGDKAGIKAAMRGTELILDSGLNIKIVIFPDNHDPDSYINSVGFEEFKSYIKNKAKDFITFKTEILLSDSQNDPLKKATVIREMVESIAKIQDPIQRSLYFKRCSQLLDIDEQVIITEYNKIVINKQIKSSKQEENLPPLPPENMDFPHIPADLEGETIVENHFSIPDADSNIEKEIIRILIEYGDFPLDEQHKLYQSLFNYIANVEFKIDIVNKIIDLYKNELDLGNIPGLEYFMLNPDKEIEAFLAKTLNNRHEISQQWFNKYQIYVPEKDFDIQFLLDKSIARLNFEKIRQQFKENQHKLAEISPENWEEMDKLLETQQVIKSYQMIYAKEMGLVVSG